MAMTNLFESQVLAHIFQNAAITLIGDAAGLLPSAGAGSLYISLHTADPTAAGNQTTNEAAYTSYARVAVARTGGAWTISGTSPTQVVNAATTNFPAATGGSETETYFGIGTASAGTGKLLYSGALTSPLAVSSGITPSFALGILVVTQL